MVNVNIWFVGRSRSTALTRCVSNIPGTTIFHENLLAAHFEQHGGQAFKERSYEFGSASQIEVMEKYRKDKSKFRVLKEFPLVIQPDFYPDIVTADSVNIFSCFFSCSIQVSFSLFLIICFFPGLKISPNSTTPELEFHQVITI